MKKSVFTLYQKNLIYKNGNFIENIYFNVSCIAQKNVVFKTT